MVLKADNWWAQQRLQENQIQNKVNVLISAEKSVASVQNFMLLVLTISEIFQDEQTFEIKIMLHPLSE